MSYPARADISHKCSAQAASRSAIFSRCQIHLQFSLSTASRRARPPLYGGRYHLHGMSISTCACCCRRLMCPRSRKPPSSTVRQSSMLAIQVFDHKKFRKRDQGRQSPRTRGDPPLTQLAQVSSASSTFPHLKRSRTPPTVAVRTIPMRRLQLTNHAHRYHYARSHHVSEQSLRIRQAALWFLPHLATAAQRHRGDGGSARAAPTVVATAVCTATPTAFPRRLHASPIWARCPSPSRCSREFPPPHVISRKSRPVALPHDRTRPTSVEHGPSAHHGR